MDNEAIAKRPAEDGLLPFTAMQSVEQHAKRQVLSNNDGVFSLSARSRILQSLPLLTHRELEVLVLFACDPSDRNVAKRLGTSIWTVRNQIVSIMHKLGVTSRAELVAAILVSWFMGDWDDLYPKSWQETGPYRRREGKGSRRAVTRRFGPHK